MKDLSTVKTSMTSVITNNLDKINACTSVSELVCTLDTLFAEHNINTEASKRLLVNVSNKHGLDFALSAVYNSVLYGSNLGVLD